jgi:hypothetical protein
MRRLLFSSVLAGCAGWFGCTGSFSGDLSPVTPAPIEPKGPGCRQDAAFFARDVWPTLSQSCVACHTVDGVAITEGKARFVLQRPNERGFLDANRSSLKAMAEIDLKGENGLLLKVQGKASHGGGAVLSPDSVGFKKLQEFSDRVRGVAPECTAAAVDPFEGLTLKSWPSTLRKVSLNLNATLPSAEALAAVADEAAFDAQLDKVMASPQFYAWVRESWNDVLKVAKGRLELQRQNIYDTTGSRDRYLIYTAALFNGATDVTPPSYDNVRAEIIAARTGEPAPYGNAVRRVFLSDTAHREEPLRLISHVVANDLPFTQILTADFTVVNAHLAQLLDVPGFPAPTLANYEEWKPVQLIQAAQKYDGNLNPLAPSPDRKDFPITHAGVLSTASFLTRWPTTPTNKSRSRVRVLAEAFLGLDVLKISQRQIVPSELTTVDNPPRNSGQCAVCHVVIDPLAGAFRGFTEDNIYLNGRRLPDGAAWHDEMFPPGYGKELMPASEYNRALPWMTKRLAADPRFPVTVVKHTLKALTGADLLEFPKSDSADGEQEFVAWQAQQDFVNQTAAAFQAANYNYKWLVRTIIKSPYYRAEVAATESPRLASLGQRRLLTPEMLSRKLKAIFGVSMGVWDDRYRLIDIFTAEPWGKSFVDEVTEPTGLLFALGGTILSKERNSARQEEVNPAIALVADVVASSMSCRQVPNDFARLPANRLLFTDVEPTTLPGANDASNAAIRKNLVRLYERLLGEVHEPNDAEITAAFALLNDTYQELKVAGKAELLCQGVTEPREYGVPQGAPIPVAQHVTSDPQFTIRAWSTVVHALLTDDRFLYE